MSRLVVQAEAQAQHVFWSEQSTVSAMVSFRWCKTRGRNLLICRNCLAGDALVYGKSVRRDMAQIRKMLGVCPQHDVIWSELTVREHLEFFSKATLGSKELGQDFRVRMVIGGRLWL